ncbi:MAG TPA: carboxypeptidase regulatory-like domain-containing protein, partial [Thermoanaerobaculia bacterium]
MKGASMKNYRVIIGCTLLLFATSVFAQYQTGNIYGKVVTTGGGGLPGVTVTLTGIGAPQTFITESDGNFRFLNLSPGSYNVRAELEGLGVAVKTGVQVNIGNNTNISLPLTPKTSESITITATAPLVDTRETKTGATITNEELKQIPTARDPWVMLQQAPGVLIDRINVGGNESGQQSNYTANGVTGDQATWNIDGVNITDMGALGSSPTYYDFDAFEEMQITTSGTDPRIATPGVQLNMVAKRGTNDIKGSGRFFDTSHSWQANSPVPAEATSYLSQVNQINSVQDRGLEVGGPIWRDHVWAWGSYGQNDIKNLPAVPIDASTGSAILFPLQHITLKDSNAKINAQL